MEEIHGLDVFQYGGRIGCDEKAIQKLVSGHIIP